jgi:hypothetical protein
VAPSAAGAVLAPPSGATVGQLVQPPQQVGASWSPLLAAS